MDTYVKIINYIFSSCGQEFVTQLIMVFLLFVGLPKRKFFILRYLISIAVITGLGWFFSKVVVIVPYEYLLFFALIVFAIFVCFKENFIQSLFIGVLIYSMQHFISCFSYSVTFLFTLGITDINEFFAAFFPKYFVIMPISMIIFSIANYYLLARPISKDQSLQFNSAVVLFAATVLIIAAVFLTHYAQQAAFFSINLQIYIRLFSMLLAVTVVFIICSNRRNKTLQDENRVLQLLLTKDRQQYRLSKMASEKIQIKYHDIMQRKSSQGIVDYRELSEIDDDKEILFSRYFTGNRALDIVLSEKALECERADIRLICTADGTAMDFMKSYHIYSLIGNALENSIECLNGYDRDELKEIEMSVTKQRDMCVIKISNYAENVIFAEDGLPATTKLDVENHGYGLKSMKNVVEIYGGEITFSFKNNTFTVNAVIPIK